MTARLWRKSPPSKGDLFRAQTGRRKDTTFAICRVINVIRWNGKFHAYIVAEDGGLLALLPDFYSPQDIAHKEGFLNWFRFYEAYKYLNAHHWGDETRTHYFVEFEVVEVIE